MKNKMVPLLVIGALIMGVYFLFSGNGKKPSTSVAVKMPVLSTVAASGQAIFKINCSQCHGPSAGGTRQGPPLIHKYYEPNHHADRSEERRVGKEC